VALPEAPAEPDADDEDAPALSDALTLSEPLVWASAPKAAQSINTDVKTQRLGCCHASTTAPRTSGCLSAMRLTSFIMKSVCGF
jgi:hypothetical protein